VLSPRLYSTSAGRTARCAQSTLLTSLQIDKLKQALVQKDCEIIELQQVTKARAGYRWCRFVKPLALVIGNEQNRIAKRPGNH
jgi:hypothetical protein